MAKILVIDDEASAREILKRILEGVGHKVLCINDGVYAEKVIRAYGPDLIVCDIMMPEVDGLILTNSLKYDSEFDKIPIILLTALGEENSYLGSQVNADCYMAKPFDEDKLLEKVDELLYSD